MAILYGTMISIARLWRWMAQLRYARLQRIYALLEDAFRVVESESKMDEVAMGRPADYAAQLKLLKSFEAKEAARLRWVRVAQKLKRR